MDLFGDLPPPKSSECNTHGFREESDGQLLKRKLDDKLDDAKRRKQTSNADDHCSYELCSFVAERKGERAEMQDAHVIMDDCTSIFSHHQNVSRAAFYAVFDGHAGSNASSFAAEHLLPNIVAKFPPVIVKIQERGNYDEKEVPNIPLNVLGDNSDKEIKKALTDAFKDTDEAFLQEASKANPPWKDGSTAACILIINNTIYAANVGDSRAFLVREKGSETNSLISLSKDHSPIEYQERQRIQKAGGVVRDGRVLGILEVSRSFGDSRFKKHGVTSLPDITKCNLSENDKYIIIACDGLWKGFDAQKAVSFIDSDLKENNKERTSSSSLDNACSNIANEAIRRGCADNVTVILVGISTK